MNSISTPSGTPQIIVAEDDTDDQKLLMEAFTENQVIETAITFVQDGIELIDTLTKLAVRPTIILLDLNMPKMDGRQALKRLKADPETRRIPVIVLTTSNAEEDIEQTYDLGVSSYITKPSNFEGLQKIVHMLNAYWSTLVTLPAAVET